MEREAEAKLAGKIRNTGDTMIDGVSDNVAFCTEESHIFWTFVQVIEVLDSNRFPSNSQERHGSQEVDTEDRILDFCCTLCSFLESIA